MSFFADSIHEITLFFSWARGVCFDFRSADPRLPAVLVLFLSRPMHWVFGRN